MCASEPPPTTLSSVGCKACVPDLIQTETNLRAQLTVENFPFTPSSLLVCLV
jgi:hypothetical protein